MYSVYCDDICIYNDLASEKEARLIAPTVEWADNSSGSFTFTMPECNTGYKDLVLMQSKIKIFRDNVEIWEGRPIKETKDFWKNRQITCEGALGYLNDVIQPQREMPDDGQYAHFNSTPRDFLNVVIGYHNERMRAIGRTDRLFEVGEVTVTDLMKNEDPDGEYDGELGWKPTIYTDQKTTLELISEKLVSGKNQNGDDLEGHIRVRKVNDKFVIDYLKEPTVLSDQTIEFGKNLLDFTTNFDETDFCTVIYPRGNSEGESIGSMNAYLELGTDLNGTYYRDDLEFQVDAPRIIFKGNKNTHDGGVNSFGYIERIYDKQEIVDDEELLNKALEWFTKNRFNDMELEIKAFDLAYLGVENPFINYMENVRVISIPHGLDKLFPVLNVSIPLDNPSNATYTLGKKRVQSLSTYSSSVDTKLESTKEYAAAQSSSALTKALTESGDMIRHATTGKVCIIPTTGDSGTAEFLVIANFTDDQIQKFISGELDIRQATNPMWAWSMGGLGFFPNGLVSIPNVAMDMLGRINATMITTGILNADLLKAGKIVGRDIEGSKITGSTIRTETQDSSGNPLRNVYMWSNSVLWSFAPNNNEGMTIAALSNHPYKGTSYEYLVRIAPSGRNSVALIGNSNFGLLVDSMNSRVQYRPQGNNNDITDDYEVVNKKWVEDYVEEHGGGVSSVSKGTTYTDTSKHRVTQLNISPTTGNVEIGYGYVTDGSDKRLKDQIIDLPDFEDLYVSLVPRQYKFKDDLDHFTKGIHFGLIAQEVEEFLLADDYYLVEKVSISDEDEDIKRVIPDDDEYYAINYEELHALHIQMIQKHQSRINELEERISRLETVIKEIGV